MKSLSDFKPYEVMYVDAMNLSVRNHYGMLDFEYHGKKTGMLYGMSRLFIDWQRKAPGIEIVMLWEGKDSWRKAKWPIYKGQRREARSLEEQDAFWGCVDQVKNALPSMGIKQAWSPTYEADDVVANLAKVETRKALFSSGDWDWWELADYGDILYQHHDVLMRSDMDAMFEKKFNADPVAPDRLWLFKVLTGDPSDNVPGVPWFPKKLAAKLCNLDGIDEKSIVAGLKLIGSDTWAERVADNKWIIDRNLDLIKSSDIPLDDIEWIEGDYSKEKFEDVLLKSGMDQLHDRFMEVANGIHTAR